MKKAFFTLCSVSLLLASAGCTQKNDVTDIEFAPPATKDLAVLVEFDKGEILHMELPNRDLSGKADKIKSGETASVDISSISMSEGSRYVLSIDGKATKASGLPTKTVWTGRFIYNFDSKEYELDGFGKLSLKEKGCRILPAAVKAGYGDPIEISATITNIHTNDIVASNLSRSWKVLSTYISVKGGKNEVSISRGFDACDFHEIGVFCQSQNVNLSNDDLAALEGYKVDEIMLEGNNSIIITFDSREPFYGSYSSNGTSFSWSLNDSNKLLSASSNGVVGFPKNGQVELVMNSTVTAGDETYTGTITFTMGQVN